MRMYILGLALVLTGCASNGGFSTGGPSSRLPPELYHVYIETFETDSPFHQAMRQELMSQGVRIADMLTQTKTIFRISRENVERRAGSSATSDRNAAREYQLIYTATFVVTVDGREILFPETLTAYRNYTSRGDQNQGGMMRSAEEDSILDTLARDMARQAMRKLTSLRL